MNGSVIGVGKIFSREEQSGIFPKFFPWGPKVVKLVFYPSKLNKQPFFANNFKIQGARPSPAPLPTPIGSVMYVVCYERVCCEQVCYERGLFRVVCYEWSVMKKSLLNGHLKGLFYSGNELQRR